MEITFDTLIESYLATQVGIAHDFLSPVLAAHLKDNLNKLFNNDEFHSAGTGNQKQVVHNTLVRSDHIYWLDRKHKDEHENTFFDLMDNFVQHLNRTCYTGITGYEFHYTLYPAGCFYKKHIDQFQKNGTRAFSMVMYLNDNWIQSDGGELCVHHADHLQHIAPINGKSVFFKSNELEHEVLTTNKPRLSITGWLKVN